MALAMHLLGIMRSTLLALAIVGALCGGAFERVPAAEAAPRPKATRASSSARGTSRARERLLDRLLHAPDDRIDFRAERRPVDYTSIVGDGRVLFIRAGVSDAPARFHLAAHVKELKAAGITHYAIEAPPHPALDRLNSGAPVDLSQVRLGPMSEGSETTVRAFAREGITVVPIDVDPAERLTRDEREGHWTAAVAAIVTGQPGSRVAVLVSSVHTVRRADLSGIAPMGMRLEQQGIKTVVVAVDGGGSELPRLFGEGVRKAGLAREEFMLDLRSHAVPSEGGGPGAEPASIGNDVDHVVHLPQRD